MKTSSGMVKLFSPGDWSNADTTDNQIKIASRGLGPEDKHRAKKFASDELLHWLSVLKTNPDCVYVHKIAMSGSDRFGPNRWGDGFREEVLRRDVPTFEVHAKAYRNHKSDNAPYYGRPKIARLREDLGTVELVTEYYGTDKVARDNGGLVADKEIESLTRHGYIPVSMGSHVPGDECKICGHWAKTRKEHCLSKKEGGCCELFGCRNGMLKIAADGRQQYVDNPLNCFFDISSVLQGADPVANGLLLPLGMFDGEAGHKKVAEFSDKLAEYIPDQVRETTLVLTPERRSALQLAYVWASMEQKLANFDMDDVDLGLALTEDVGELQPLFYTSTAVQAATINSFAKLGVCPTFTAFAKAAGLNDAEIECARPYVPQVYTRLINSGAMDSVIKSINLEKNTSDFFAKSKTAGIDNTYTREAVLHRGLKGNAEGKQVKRVDMAAMDSKVPAVVAKYATFKLAWACRADLDPWLLHTIARREFSRTENRDS
jgi:hypothetical protein